MRKSALVFLAMVLMGVMGCTALDTLVGIDPQIGEKTGPGVVESARPFAPLVGPYGTVAVEGLGVLALIYTFLRGKKYKAAALSGVRGVEEIVKAFEDKKVTKEEVVAILKKIQEKDGTRDVVRKLIKENT